MICNIWHVKYVVLSVLCRALVAYWVLSITFCFRQFRRNAELSLSRIIPLAKNCARAYQSLSELVVYIKGCGPEQQKVVTDARHPSCYRQRERSLRTFWQTNRSKARIEAAYQVYLLIDSFFI